MTKEEILAMEASDSLDDLIKRHVMGWKLRQIGSDPLNAEYYWYEGDELISSNIEGLKFSTDISVTFEVVEKMNDCLHLKEHGEHGEWEASFCGSGCNEKGHGETPALAICRAALLAVMEETK